MSNSTERSPFQLRLDPDLKDWLKHQAILNRRSLTKEIEYRLKKGREGQEKTA